jgi:hypothetical protein
MTVEVSAESAPPAVEMTVEVAAASAPPAVEMTVEVSAESAPPPVEMTVEVSAESAAAAECRDLSTAAASAPPAVEMTVEVAAASAAAAECRDLSTAAASAPPPVGMTALAKGSRESGSLPGIELNILCNSGTVFAAHRRCKLNRVLQCPWRGCAVGCKGVQPVYEDLPGPGRIVALLVLS